jgi:uncharacterized protein YyaL (SSP411 family)
VVRGFTDLYEAGFDPAALRFGEEVAESLLARFQDERAGGFYFTEAGQKDLLHRSKGGWDGALPSGTTLAISGLLRLSRHLDRADFRDAVERALASTGAGITRAPRAFLGMLAVLDDFLREPVVLVVSGGRQDPRTRALLGKARQTYLPGMVFSLVEADPGLPLHRDRGPVAGAPAAYLCRSRACLAPITDPEVLGARLAECR